MSGPDFVHLDDQPIRVTSLTRDGDRVRLVVILRGSRAQQQLLNVLRQPTVRLTVPGEPERTVSVERAEHVASGEGERALYRHTVVFGPAEDIHSEPADDLTARLDRIEHKLDQILAHIERQSVDDAERRDG